LAILLIKNSFVFFTILHNNKKPGIFVTEYSIPKYVWQNGENWSQYVEFLLSFEGVVG